MKSDVRSENVSWKISDYVSLPLFEFTLAINLRNFDFKSHWNTFIIFDRKRYGVRFEYVPLKNVWFVSVPLFGFTLVIKMTNFDF